MIKDTIKHLLNEIQHILVVNKLYVAPINFFLRVFFLFHFKNVLQALSIRLGYYSSQKKEKLK